jgi:flagellar motor protein MotB
MAKDLEYLAKSKAEEAEKRLEQGIDDAATSLRRKGREFQEYLKKLNAEVEEWKFGVEESRDGFRVEWRVVALIRRPKKKSDKD